jgi:hypothetical protein
MCNFIYFVVLMIHRLVEIFGLSGHMLARQGLKSTLIEFMSYLALALPFLVMIIGEDPLVSFTIGMEDYSIYVVCVVICRTRLLKQLRMKCVKSTQKNWGPNLCRL